MAIIDKAGDYFNTVLYTGNSSNRNITGVGFSPDLVWIKDASRVENHALYDTTRGATKKISTDSTAAQGNENITLTAFGSDGFSLGTGSLTNYNNDIYNSWNWKKQAGVFDIVTYTGNGSARTISHNLGAVPTYIILKNTSGVFNWGVYNTYTGNTKTTELNKAVAPEAISGAWNNTSPTASVFSVGNDNTFNQNGATFIAYLFGNSSISRVGNYEGNGSTDGPFVYLGFKPAWIMLRKNGAQSWTIQNNKSNPINNGGNMKALKADTTGTQEDEASHRIDYLSNGFKLRYNWEGNNSNGTRYFYLAFAENPFVTSTDNNSIPSPAR